MQKETISVNINKEKNDSNSQKQIHKKPIASIISGNTSRKYKSAFVHRHFRQCP